MRNRQTMLEGSQGFTLIELLVVIAVVGILSAAVISGINPTQRFKEARDAQRKTIVGTLATAMEACYTKNSGSYITPTTCGDLKTLNTAGYVRSDYSSYDVAGTSLVLPVFSALAKTDAVLGTTGCISTKLEAPTGTNTNWTWQSSTGTAAETVGGCP